MPESSTYLRYRAQTGRFIPFAPPLPSPKHTGALSPRQRLHLMGWRWLWPLWSMALGGRYKLHRPIFLIGCHNSGTTIFSRLIGQHRDVAHWSEAPEVWAPDDAFLNWSVMPEPPLDVPFLFDLRAYERTVADHAEFIPTIQRSFGFFAASRMRRRFLNKNPHMSISIPYIEAAFPDACYVYIRRNGYAVVQSLVSNWRPVLQRISDPSAPDTDADDGWGKLRDAIDPKFFDDPLELVRLCARYWRDIDDCAVNDLQALSDQSRVYYTSYEAICEDAEGILREVLPQLGLDAVRYDWDQLREPMRYPWTDMLPMENRNFKYRERLTGEEIDAVTEEVRDQLAAHDYLDED